MRAISISLGMDYGTVRRRLVTAGVRIEKRHAWNRRDDIPVDRLMELYNSGMGCNALGRMFRIHESSIADRLRAAGCTMRPASYPPRHGADNPAWKGGRSKLPTGYVLAYVGSGKKHRYEHRVVMERVLGRPLKRSEHVHHLNGIRDDNRPSNLVALDASAHKKEGPTFVRLLQQRIRDLEGLIPTPALAAVQEESRTRTNRS